MLTCKVQNLTTEYNFACIQLYAALLLIKTDETTTFSKFSGRFRVSCPVDQSIAALFVPRSNYLIGSTQTNPLIRLTRLFATSSSSSGSWTLAATGVLECRRWCRMLRCPFRVIRSAICIDGCANPSEWRLNYTHQIVPRSAAAQCWHGTAICTTFKQNTLHTYRILYVTRVEIAGVWCWTPPSPSSCLQTLIFEWKSVVHFTPGQNFKHLDIWPPPQFF